MGGGRQEFLPTWETDVDGLPGKRTDGLNLIKQWQQQHKHDKAVYAQTRDDMLNVMYFILFYFIII